MKDPDTVVPFLLAALAVVVPDLRPRERFCWRETSNGIEVWIESRGPVKVSCSLRREQLLPDPVAFGTFVADEILRRLREPITVTVLPDRLDFSGSSQPPQA